MTLAVLVGCGVWLVFLGLCFLMDGIRERRRERREPDGDDWSDG